MKYVSPSFTHITHRHPQSMLCFLCYHTTLPLPITTHRLISIAYYYYYFCFFAIYTRCAGGLFRAYGGTNDLFVVFLSGYWIRWVLDGWMVGWILDFVLDSHFLVFSPPPPLLLALPLLLLTNGNQINTHHNTCCFQWMIGNFQLFRNSCSFIILSLYLPAILIV